MADEQYSGNVMCIGMELASRLVTTLSCWKLLEAVCRGHRSFMSLSCSSFPVPLGCFEISPLSYLLNNKPVRKVLITKSEGLEGHGKTSVYIEIAYIGTNRISGHLLVTCV